MITPESLLQLALEAEEKYLALSKQFPPGTYSPERNEAKEIAEQALICAAWMKANGHEQLRYVGPFGQIYIQNGDHVRLKAGSLFKSTAPNSPPEGERLKRAHTVRVRGSVTRGYVLDGEVFQPYFTWAGSGGYWRRTDLNNIETSEKA